MWERKEEGLGEGRRGRPWGEEEEEVRTTGMIDSKSMNKGG